MSTIGNSMINARLKQSLAANRQSRDARAADSAGRRDKRAEALARDRELKMSQDTERKLLNTQLSARAYEQQAQNRNQREVQKQDHANRSDLFFQQSKAAESAARKQYLRDIRTMSKKDAESRYRAAMEFENQRTLQGDQAGYSQDQMQLSGDLDRRNSLDLEDSRARNFMTRDVVQSGLGQEDAILRSGLGQEDARFQAGLTEEAAGNQFGRQMMGQDQTDRAAMERLTAQGGIETELMNLKQQFGQEDEIDRTIRERTEQRWTYSEGMEPYVKQLAAQEILLIKKRNMHEIDEAQFNEGMAKVRKLKRSMIPDVPPPGVVAPDAAAFRSQYFDKELGGTWSEDGKFQQLDQGSATESDPFGGVQRSGLTAKEEAEEYKDYRSWHSDQRNDDGSNPAGPLKSKTQWMREELYGQPAGEDERKIPSFKDLSDIKANTEKRAKEMTETSNKHSAFIEMARKGKKKGVDKADVSQFLVLDNFRRAAIENNNPRGVAAADIYFEIADKYGDAGPPPDQEDEWLDAVLYLQELDVLPKETEIKKKKKSHRSRSDRLPGSAPKVEVTPTGVVPRSAAAKRF